MKNNSILKFILYVAFLPFILLYLVYKSNLSKNTKIIIYTLFVLVFIVYGSLNGSFDNVNSKNTALNVTPSNPVVENDKRDVEEVKDTNLVVSNEEKDEQTKTDTSVEEDENEDSQQLTDEQNYTAMVSTWAYDFAGDFSELSDLLINNNIESTSWNSKVLNTSNKLIEDCRVVIDFKPPTGYEKINENVVNACTNYMYGVTDLLDGLRELDEDKIESAQIFFMLGTEFIKIATEQLNNK